MTDTLIPASPSKRDYTEREDYTAQMARNEAPIFGRADPIGLFAEWMSDARTHELNDSNAMALSTVDESGMPDVRMVLLKGIDERGFVFYTNANSVKGQQLAATPKAALCFHWKSLRRQVRVRGAVSRVSTEEADVYFGSRARGSQIGAWASDQSAPVEDAETLRRRVDAVEAEYEGKDIPRPPHWYGWRVTPQSIEFWRDRPYRLHDRLLFSRGSDNASWKTARLYP